MIDEIQAVRKEIKCLCEYLLTTLIFMLIVLIESNIQNPIATILSYIFL